MKLPWYAWYVLAFCAVTFVYLLFIEPNMPECWEDEVIVQQVDTGTYHCVAVDDLDVGYRP